WQSLVLLKDMGRRPRRTLRLALFTNEENGIAGGKAYHSALAGDFKSHAAAIEMDGGCERPAGFGITVRKPASRDRRGESRRRPRRPTHAARARSRRSARSRSTRSSRLTCSGRPSCWP
ncbi:MAG TPA: M28 family peptidase, partial [Myxococcota bacterium]|nr:M28 family peptidase [Myxococcota bacterium]